VLPPELLRKGRFDDIFFVDLPNQRERQSIFGIHLEHRKRKKERFKLAKLAKQSRGFSGAEIEQVIISALFDAYYHRRDVTDDDILISMSETVPLSKTMEEEIRALREWSFTRTRHATVTKKSSAAKSGRKLEFK